MLTLILAINLNSSPGDVKPKSPEPFSSVAVDEIPDVPNNSFLLRRSRTPSPVREKRLQQAKNRYVSSEVHLTLIISTRAGLIPFSVHNYHELGIFEHVSPY